MSIVISGSGTISGVSATGITTAQTVSASSITTGTLPKGQLPAGSVIQTVCKTTTDQAAYTLNNTFEQATVMNTSITPTSASSKILITVSVMFGDAGSGAYPGFIITRNGSEITAAKGVTNGSRKLLTASGGSIGGAGGSWIQNISIDYLDSPATTSAVTYGIQVTGYGSRTFYINITGTNDGNAGVAAVSSMTLLEIAG